MSEWLGLDIQQWTLVLEGANVLLLLFVLLGVYLLSKPRDDEEPYDDEI